MSCAKYVQARPQPFPRMLYNSDCKLVVSCFVLPSHRVVHAPLGDVVHKKWGGLICHWHATGLYAGNVAHQNRTCRPKLMPQIHRAPLPILALAEMARFSAPIPAGKADPDLAIALMGYMSLYPETHLRLLHDHTTLIAFVSLPHVEHSNQTLAPIQ